MRVAGERWTSSAGRSAAPRRSPGDTTKQGSPPVGGVPRGRSGSAGEVEQRPGVARVPQLRQRLLLELTDPLAGQAEVLAGLAERGVEADRLAAGAQQRLDLGGALVELHGQLLRGRLAAEALVHLALDPAQLAQHLQDEFVLLVCSVFVVFVAFVVFLVFLLGV